MKKLSIILVAILLNNGVSAKTEAIVNGVKITSKAVQTLQDQAKKELGRKIDRKEIVTSLVRAEVMKQEAYKQGFEKNPEIVQQLQQIKDKLVMDAYIKNLVLGIKISDKEYKRAYKKHIKTLPKYQYKASHILVKKSSEAKQIIKDLNKKKANFADIAKAKSTGPSGKNGGSLGWFDSASMVKEFSNAVQNMKVGSHSKRPVKTKFGYHVILLEDKKSNELPKLDALKSNLRNQIIQPKLLKKIEQVVKKAKVKIIK